MSVATAATPDEIVATAIAAVRQGESATHQALDHLPAAIYTTDARGRITYFNKACVAFAGRTPELGRDSWCVSWKLYTEKGEFLPHERCPMALAIQQKKAVRGWAAIAERPDGTRVDFVPYPTPMLDEHGEVIGAVNLLVDVTDRKKAHFLRDQALRCRRLARSINDAQTVTTLTLMAAEYDEQARALGRAN